ncbi:MAG TPA: aldolase/citrate lyase family protein [Ramlibacter sp.]|jgi:hypothetical protein
MLELIQITNDAAFARRCDAIGGFRIFVDLERMGKAERQAGRNTFISEHQLADVARIRAVLRNSRLMVRVNPLHAESAHELDAVLAHGPDCVMLPMFSSAAELAEFSRLLRARAPLVALLETVGAFHTLHEWIATPGLQEVFVGLNDLHISLGCRFMFEPLADGTVERVTQACRARGLRFGFGGIARLDEGLLPGRDVLAEHLRLGSTAVILSRTFHRADAATVFEDEVAALRAAEAQLAARTPAQQQLDAQRIATAIARIAGAAPARP